MKIRQAKKILDGRRSQGKNYTRRQVNNAFRRFTKAKVRAGGQMWSWQVTVPVIYESSNGQG